MSLERELADLRDPDYVVRNRAARALVFRFSGSDGPRPAPVFFQLLPDQSALDPVNRLIAEGMAPDSDAVREKLKEATAAMAVAAMRPALPPGLFAPAPSAPSAAGRPPGDPRAVGPLLAAADDPTKNVRTSVGRALAVIVRTAPGRGARNELRAALGADNWRVRFAAARAFAWLGDEPYEPLLPLLDDEHESLRWAAAKTLAARHRGSFGHFSDLVNAFRDRPEPQPELAGVLLRVLEDGAPTVRLAAISALDPSDDAGAYGALVAALRDDPERGCVRRPHGGSRTSARFPCCWRPSTIPSRPYGRRRCARSRRFAPRPSSSGCCRCAESERTARRGPEPRDARRRACDRPARSSVRADDEHGHASADRAGARHAPRQLLVDEGHAARQHLAAVPGDEHVVLEADAAEVEIRSTRSQSTPSRSGARVSGSARSGGTK